MGRRGACKAFEAFVAGHASDQPQRRAGEREVRVLEPTTERPTMLDRTRGDAPRIERLKPPRTTATPEETRETLAFLPRGAESDHGIGQVGWVRR
jgi:hypothetical protein